jgi:catechol 2,3-dioxygenase
VAILYPTQAALADALLRLRAAEWPLRTTIDHGTHIALYLADPDGNGLELAWDRPRDQWPRAADGTITEAGGPVDLDALLAHAPQPARS